MRYRVATGRAESGASLEAEADSWYQWYQCGQLVPMQHYGRQADRQSDRIARARDTNKHGLNVMLRAENQVTES